MNSTSHKNNRLRCPWPGPVPYKEEDADRFFGREAKLEELLVLINNQQLSILTALSGVGKSSLLQAGLVPALRILREKGGRIGPTLVLRGWGHLAGVPPAEMLAAAIRGEILRLAQETETRDETDRLCRDVRALIQVADASVRKGDVKKPAVEILVDYVVALCEVTDGIVLIIDQAEELLGSGVGRPDPELERKALSAIGSIFEDEPRAKLVISLREEYYSRLKPLERYVKSLEKRVVRLDPMPLPTARKVVIESAEIEKFPLDEAQLEAILSWLWTEDDAQESDKDLGAVDLLRLQALLVYVFEWVHEHFGDDALISESTLAQFRAQHDVKDLAEHALKYHIDRVLNQVDGVDRDLVRRVVVRMARWLSSPGGFKRHTEESDLILNALREDFLVLEVAGQDDDTRRSITELKRSCGTLRGIAFRQGSDPDEISDRLSGRGRVKARRMPPGENPVRPLTDTATTLVRSSFQALDILEDGEVLKAGQWRGRASWELVHDGFGPALIRWAEEEEKAFRDTISSLVSRRGETFRWQGQRIGSLNDETLELANLCWLGCNLRDVTLENVHFINCNLRGTIFTDCQLRGCSFEGCTLEGSVFRGGSWLDVEWSGGRGTSALFLRLQWKNVLFKSASLQGSTFVWLHVDGSVEFYDCNMCFSQIEQLERASGGQFKVRKCDFRNGLFRDKDVEWAEIVDCLAKNLENLVNDLPGIEDIPRGRA